MPGFNDARVDVFSGTPGPTARDRDNEAVVRSLWQEYAQVVAREGWFDQALQEARTPMAPVPEPHRPDTWNNHLPSTAAPSGKLISLVSFSTPNFAEAQNGLSLSALRVGEIDQAVLWTTADFAQTACFKDHPALLSRRRGGGYWAWKPYIIHQEMLQCEDGDYVIYHDSGRGPGLRFERSVRDLVDWCEASPHGILPGVRMDDVGPSRFWIKRDCFVVMDCDSAAYWEYPQVSARFSVWKNSAFARQFVREWLDYALDPRTITDHPNVCGLPNLDGFIDHRHDQAILTNLTVRHKLNPPALTSGSASEIGMALRARMEAARGT